MPYSVVNRKTKWGPFQAVAMRQMNGLESGRPEFPQRDATKSNGLHRSARNGECNNLYTIRIGRSHLRLRNIAKCAPARLLSPPWQRSKNRALLESDTGLDSRNSPVSIGRRQREYPVFCAHNASRHYDNRLKHFAKK